jgi:ankyrin repeat protein
VLIKSGCDLNAQDIIKNTALHYACIYGHKKIVVMLLKNPRVEIDIRNNEKKLPVELTVAKSELNRIFNDIISNVEVTSEKEDNHKIIIISTNTETVKQMFERPSSPLLKIRTTSLNHSGQNKSVWK